MTDFLARLAARVLNTAPVVEPVLTSRYAPGDEGPSAPIGSWREREAAPVRGPRSPEPLGLEEITREVESTPPGVPAPRDTGLVHEDAPERSPVDAAPVRRRPARTPSAVDDVLPSDDDGLLVPPPARRAHARLHPADEESIEEEDHLSAPSAPRHRPAAASDASTRSAESGESIDTAASTESTELIRSDAAASPRPSRRSSAVVGDETVVEVHEEIVSSSPSSRARPSAPRSVDAAIGGRLTDPAAADRPTPAHSSAPVAVSARAGEDDRALLVPTHKPRARAHDEDAEEREDAGTAAASLPARGRRAGRDEGADDAAPPTIKVSVGRVEIRALEPPARRRRPERGGEKTGAGWSPPVLSLDTYLRGGAGR